MSRKAKSRKAVLVLWPLLALVALSGCMHRRSGCDQAPPEEAPGLLVPRTRIDPDARVAPIAMETRAGDKTYWGMTPCETQCRAAQESGTAELMRREYESLDQQNCLVRISKATRMKKTMLRHSSVEARNIAAGTALELYFRLAELEAKSDLLRDGQVIVQDSLEELRKIKGQGLKVPPEFEKLEKQQLELQADLVRAQLGIQQINGELSRLLNWRELGVHGYLWPLAHFKVTEIDDDMDVAIAVGMTHRAHLSMLRAIREDVDAKTLPTLMLLLRSYNGFLGMTRSEGFFSFLSAGGPGRRGEVGKRRAQMDELIDEQEFIVAQEIRQAVHTSRAKTKLVALARVKIQQHQEKLRDLEEKRERGVVSVLELSAQKLNVAQAQAELIQEVMAWHTARAKLKQAQGLLALECGFTPENPWPAKGACNPLCGAAPALLSEPVGVQPLDLEPLHLPRPAAPAANRGPMLPGAYSPAKGL